MSKTTNSSETTSPESKSNNSQVFLIIGTKNMRHLKFESSNVSITDDHKQLNRNASMYNSIPTIEVEMEDIKGSSLCNCEQSCDIY